MADNTLLTISSQDIAGALFLAAYVIVAVLMFAADYGIRHGWFVPTDEACEQYRQRIVRQKNASHTEGTEDASRQRREFNV